MTLEIDTGAEIGIGAIAYVSDWMKDMCPPTYTHAQTVQAYAHHVMGDIKRPAKLDTVRKHLRHNWLFLGLLADEQPGLFDEIWTEYVERILSE